LGASPFALGQQDLAAVELPTAPGLAVSSPFLAADGQEVTLQDDGEHARAAWLVAFDPSTAPGLTSACCVAEQPIRSAAVHKTLAAIVLIMDSIPLEKECWFSRRRF
jgi:hypothetical protein